MQDPNYIYKKNIKRENLVREKKNNVRDINYFTIFFANSIKIFDLII